MGLYPQNNWYGNSTLPNSQLITPLVYDESMSYLDILASMNSKIDEINTRISGFISEQIFNEFVLFMDVDQKQQSKYLEGYADSGVTSASQRLEQLIKDVTVGKVLIDDPTYGLRPRDIQTVVWTLYDFLRFYSDTAELLDTLALTAQTRDNKGATAKYFDLYNTYIYSGDVPTPPSPNEYIKKNEIYASYFDPATGQNSAATNYTYPELFGGLNASDK